MGDIFDQLAKQKKEGDIFDQMRPTKEFAQAQGRGFQAEKQQEIIKRLRSLNQLNPMTELGDPEAYVNKAKAFWSDAGNAVKGMGSMFVPNSPADVATAVSGGPLGPITTLPAKKMLEAYNQTNKQQFAQAEQQRRQGDVAGSAINYAGAAVPITGPLTSGVYEANANPNAPVGSGVGLGVSRILQAMSMAPKGGAIPNPVESGISGTAAMIQRLRSAPAVPKPVAVSRLAQAIEPDPKLAPEVIKNLDTHLDAIAQASDKPIKNISDLSEATNKAAKADPYRKTFIEPFKDTRVTLYGGAETTIGKLDARLSEINDTLYPKFNKGGPGSEAAQAAIGAEQAAGLVREASQIRGILSQELSKLTGIEAQTILAARARYGQINDLASKINQTVQERAAEARINQNTPLRVKDMNPKNVPINPRNWFGNIPDRIIADTFSGYQPSGPAAPNFSVQPPAAARPRTPIWQQAGATPTEPPSASLGSLADQAANNARIAENLRNRARIQAEARGKANHNLNKHGKDY